MISTWIIWKRKFLYQLNPVFFTPFSIIEAAGESETALVFLQIFALVYLFFVRVPLRYSAALLFLKTMRNTSFEISELFDAFYNYYLNVVLAGLLTGAI